MSNECVASKEPPKNGYGQNGYQGPSSVTPGKPVPHMNTDFGLKTDPSAAPGDWQTRNVDASPITPHNGMKSRAVNDGSPGGVLGKPARPVK